MSSFSLSKNKKDMHKTLYRFNKFHQPQDIFTDDKSIYFDSIQVWDRIAIDSKE